MSSIVSIDTRGYDISMGPGVLRVGGGGGLAGNVYINGNVGIGTSAPAYRSDVNGISRSKGLFLSDIITGGAGGQLQIPYGNYGTIFRNDGNNFYILLTNSGDSYGNYNNLRPLNLENATGNFAIATNVGVGSENMPIYPLDVSGTMRVGSGVGGLINIGRDGVGGYRSAYIYSTSTDLFILNQQPGAFQFGTNNGEKMRIDINGNVGIGTNTPTTTLDVNGAITASWTAVNRPIQVLRNITGENDSWNSRLTIVPYLGNNGYNTLSLLGDVGIIWGSNTGTNGNLVIGAHGQSAGGIKITSVGNVGIGTGIPKATLDVNGTFKTSGSVEIAKSVATPNTYIEMNSRFIDFHTGPTLTDYDSRIIADGGNGTTGQGSIHIFSSTYSVSSNPILLNGNVGIGTATPTATLDVSGTLRYSGSSVNTPKVIASGTDVKTFPVGGGRILLLTATESVSVFCVSNGDNTNNNCVMSGQVAGNDCYVVFANSGGGSTRVNYIAYKNV